MNYGCLAMQTNSWRQVALLNIIQRNYITAYQWSCAQIPIYIHPPLLFYAVSLLFVMERQLQKFVYQCSQLCALCMLCCVNTIGQKLEVKGPRGQQQYNCPCTAAVQLHQRKCDVESFTQQLHTYLTSTVHNRVRRDVCFYIEEIRIQEHKS